MMFTTMFATVISRSVPHIYLSCLPFTPKSSVVHRNWSDQFSATAQLVQGHLQNWPNIVQQFGGHGPIWCIAFSPDGKLIASGSDDKTIRLWNVEMGESIGQPMEGH